MITLKEESKNGNESGAVIKVIGVGGGGGNAVKRMVLSDMKGVEFIATNTDSQALNANPAPIRIQLGKDLTRGLGAGADPEIGRNAALEAQEEVASICESTELVFVTAGMGGGTGTGAAPVIANIARSQGALTIGVVTRPFAFEGQKRQSRAKGGVEELAKAVDSLLIIPNDRLLEIIEEDVDVGDAFRIVDQVLFDAVSGLVEIINNLGQINLDFADVRRIMKNSGLALMGVGQASGPDRARTAAELAINSPLLEDVSVHGAKSVLLYVAAVKFGLKELDTIASIIQKAAHSEVDFIIGYTNDVPESQGENIKVILVATNFDREMQESKIEQIEKVFYSTPNNPRTGEDYYSKPHQETVQKRRIYRTYSDPSQETFSFPGVNNATYAGVAAQDDYDLPAYIRQQRDKRKKD